MRGAVVVVVLGAVVAGVVVEVLDDVVVLGGVVVDGVGLLVDVREVDVEIGGGVVPPGSGVSAEPQPPATRARARTTAPSDPRIRDRRVGARMTIASSVLTSRTRQRPSRLTAPSDGSVAVSCGYLPGTVGVGA